MFGIKIGKTLREGNASVWPNGYHRLDVLLRPLADDLRPLWWATADARYDYPTQWITEGPDVGGAASEPVSRLQYRAFEDYFVADAVSPVTKPGFLPTFAHVVSGDWSVLCGLPSNPASDASLMCALERVGWFDAPQAFPPAVSVVIRGIDWAYWEIFTRDQRAIAALEQHLRGVHGLYVELLDAGRVT
jgi:hypothetical protein